MAIGVAFAITLSATARAGAADILRAPLSRQRGYLPESRRRLPSGGITRPHAYAFRQDAYHRRRHFIISS